MIPEQKAGQVIIANFMSKSKKAILMLVVATSASLSRKF
jgi:hypothetical protein